MKLSTILSTGLLSLATLNIQPQAVCGGLLPNPHHDTNAHTRAHPHPQHPVAVRQMKSKQMDQVQTVLPVTVVFHDTNVTTTGTTTGNPLLNTTSAPNDTTGTTGNAGGDGTNWPYTPTNITACTAPIYENISPQRTAIIRDDCHDLAKKVLAHAGYWTMAQWSGVGASTSSTNSSGGGQYVGLASEGTCQFAVARRVEEKLLHDQSVGRAQGRGVNGGAGAARYYYGNGTSSSSVDGIHDNNNNNNTDFAIIGNQDVYNVLHAAVFDLASQADEPYMDKMTTQGRMYCAFPFNQQHNSANMTLVFKLQYVDDNDDDSD